MFERKKKINMLNMSVLSKPDLFIDSFEKSLYY